MTVTTQLSRASFPWTGVETSFSCGFPADALPDVKVYFRTVAGLQSLLTLGVNYSGSLASGTKLVTLTPISLPAATGTVVAERATPALVNEALVDGQDFSLAVIQQLHDRAAMRSAEDRTRLSRAIVLAETAELGDGNFDLGGSGIQNMAAGETASSAATVGQVLEAIAAGGNVPPPLLADVGKSLVATGPSLFGWGFSIVTTGQLADGAVTNAKIADNSITSAKIADGAIIAADLADGSVTFIKIADGTITTADIADGAITSAKIADGTIATADISDSSITSAKIVDGTIATNDIADGAITAAKVANGFIVDRTYKEVTGEIPILAGIPLDNTIPQNTEGTFIVSDVLTPKSVTNRFRVNFKAYGGSAPAAANLIVAGFAGAAANAVAAKMVTTGGASFLSEICHEFEFVPATLSPVTIAIRCGSSAVFSLNGSSGNPLFGTSSKVTLIIEEIKA